MSQELKPTGAPFRDEIDRLAKKAFHTGRDINASGVALDILIANFLAAYHDKIEAADSIPVTDGVWDGFEAWFKANVIDIVPDGGGEPKRTVLAVNAGECIYEAAKAAWSAALSLRTAPPAESQAVEGRWRHSGGYLFCGSMRIARYDFDTNPTGVVKHDTFEAIAAAMNGSGEEPCYWLNPRGGVISAQAKKDFGDQFPGHILPLYEAPAAPPLPESPWKGMDAVTDYEKHPANRILGINERGSQAVIGMHESRKRWEDGFGVFTPVKWMPLPDPWPYAHIAAAATRPAAPDER